MPQYTSTIAAFYCVSSWNIYRDPDTGDKKKTAPSSGIADRTWDLSAIPTNAIIDYAVVTATLGSPSTGIDDCTIFYDGANHDFRSGSLDITSKVQASLSTGYMSFRYIFHANGTTAYNVGSYSSSLSFSNNAISVTYHLPYSSFTLNTYSVEAGQTITANISRADASYTHNVVFTFGGASQTFTSVATSQSFTVPLTGGGSWLYQIPNSVSGTATCVVHTYNGSGSYIGSADTQYFTITAPASVKPTIASLTPTLVNGYWSLYVQGKSKATLTTDTAVGAYGSAITSYSIWGMGNGSNLSSFTTGYLTTAGTNTFYATVTDSRGRTSNTVSCSITVTAYSSPVITFVDTDRCNDVGVLEDEGLYAKCSMSYTWSAIGSNTRTTAIYYRESGETTWILGDNTLISTGGYWIIGGSFDPGVKYDIKFVLYDYFTSGTPSTNETAPVLTSIYITDYKAEGDGVCFGGASTRSNALEVSEAWDFFLKGKLIKDYIRDVFLPVGTIYECVHAQDPNVMWGGTWVLFGHGRTTVGVDTAQSEFDTVEKTGGEKTHTISANELPNINIPVTGQYGGLQSASSTGTGDWGQTYQVGISGVTSINASQKLMARITGGGSAMNILQPFVTTYKWKRTA